MYNGYPPSLFKFRQQIKQTQLLAFSQLIWVKKRGKSSMDLRAKISNSPVDWLILNPFTEVRHNCCYEVAYQIARNKQCLTKNDNHSCI